MDGRAGASSTRRFDFPGHHLPRSALAGVGVNLSVAVTKRVDLVVGYGYGINAPRGNSFGGQEFDAQFQFKY